MARSNLKNFSRVVKDHEPEGPMSGVVVDSKPVSVETVKTKQDDAMRIVKRNMYWSMGLAVVPLPLVDLIGIAGFQTKALNELSNLYNVPFSQHRIKNIVAILIGSLGTFYLSRLLAGSAIKSLPLIGRIASISAGPVIAGALSYAIGKVFIQNLESGGTFLDLDPQAVRDYFRAQFEEGLKVAPEMSQSH